MLRSARWTLHEHWLLETYRWGALGGWIVELDGVALARLTYVRTPDMFWYTYRLEPLDGAPENATSLLGNPEIWQRCAFDFRSPRFDQVVSHALPGGELCRSGASLGSEVDLRSLYVASPPLTPTQEWLMPFYRLWRCLSAGASESTPRTERAHRGWSR